MNKKELKAQMIRSEKTVDQLCAALGICRSAWFRKINGKSWFNQGEIIRLRAELDLNDEQTGLIFFDTKVS